ncbi:hypothetical protein VTK73DRAFT_5731 [Phialemonium thermophilum]|uniref:F-box domain-containing protein n=1 Tax=Phialemonium thermophilum TaxID=223376 RepID=A0ABR3XX06_9PEZI
MIECLPFELLAEVLSYISPRDLIRDRRVCKAWFNTLTGEHISKFLLEFNFPYSRENRLPIAARRLHDGLIDTSLLASNLRVLLEVIQRMPREWTAAFTRVTKRYFHLHNSCPQDIKFVRMASETYSEQNQPLFVWMPVRALANCWHNLRSGQEIDNRDTMWCYSQDDGLLVYPAPFDYPARPTQTASKEQKPGFVYRWFDLETGEKGVVPFDARNKVIRRVRLACGLLVIEWAQVRLRKGKAAAHFATAIDVRRVAQPLRNAGGLESTTRQDAPWTWDLRYRSQWCIREKGSGFYAHTRFLSVHDATHYVMYLQSREELIVIWDISTPAPRKRRATRPTSRRAGSSADVAHQGSKGDGVSESEPQRHRKGPYIIRKMLHEEIWFLGAQVTRVHQLRNLALDRHNVYLIEEHLRWLDMGDADIWAHLHTGSAIGVPIIPFDTLNAAPTMTTPEEGQIVVYGPASMDRCGTDADVRLHSCRNVAEYMARRFFPPGDHNAIGSNLPYPWELRYVQEGLYRNTNGGRVIRPWSPNDHLAQEWPWRHVADTAADPYLLMSPSPSMPPCWRHEEFPYVTVAEMLDLAARVRISARVSPFMRLFRTSSSSKLQIQGPPAPPSGHLGIDGTGIDAFGNNSRSSLDVGVSASSADGSEHGDDDSEGSEILGPWDRDMAVESLPYDVYWDLLMGSQTIAGDERWAIGQCRDPLTKEDRISILRF